MDGWKNWRIPFLWAKQGYQAQARVMKTPPKKGVSQIHT